MLSMANFSGSNGIIYVRLILRLMPQVKFNPNRADNMIIQSIALLDQMDKDINTFAMRVREWYSWHFPELKDIVKDNFIFAKCAAFVQVCVAFCNWLSFRFYSAGN